MGQAKKELEEKEHRRRKQLEYLTKYKGYTICVECNEPFLATHDSIICDGCWREKTMD
ncbi:hypothetical protein [Priestia sp. D3YE.R1]|uniref:hypothetical protein n=1 Tax=Priestia sp. D3YE.R1 TaxID=3400416 RepID=UPI003B9DD863